MGVSALGKKTDRNERAQLVITSLLYPAFLGNMSYVAAEAFFEKDAVFALGANILLVALLLIHFIFDWIYTHTENKDHDYPPTKSVFDFVIILCLYISLRQAIDPNSALAITWPSLLREPVAWLLIAKLCAFCWELREIKGKKCHELTSLDRIEIGFDGAFVIIYGIYMYCAARAGLPIAEPGKVLLSALIALDIYGYIYQMQRKDELEDSDTPA